MRKLQRQAPLLVAPLRCSVLTPPPLSPRRRAPLGLNDLTEAGQSRGCSARSSKAVHLSEARLQEFLQAEVSFFAKQEANSISLRQILDAATPQSAAQLSHTELPIRFAQRIQQIEELPGWSSMPELVEVHGLYSQSFRDLRLVELNSRSLVHFTEVIQGLKDRMRRVIPLLASGMRNAKDIDIYSETRINDWLDSFLLSRIGTEMLTSQYIACVKATNSSASSRAARFVDHECDPAAICEQAGLHARKLCKKHYGLQESVQVVVESEGCRTSKGRIRFPYMPQYLFYILVELLKNSARATVENASHRTKIPERPIVVTVSADPSQVGIRVHDQAGGIPFEVADRVWSYMYSTASQHQGGGDQFSQQGTPLAGYGVGLPLSRLYARYLGGSLHLMSMPGVGTNAYLYLKRIETEAREELPTSIRDPELPSSW